MPLPRPGRNKYKLDKMKEAKWDTFRKGLNSYSRDTEIDSDELAEARNLVLVGRGVPTKRWGSANYFLAGESGYTRGLGTYDTTTTNELLAVTDDGLLVKKSGASYAIITGASWASGYNVNMAQLNSNMYFANGNAALTKYDGSSLNVFTQLTTPSSLLATNLSGVSGTYTYSYRVSAESALGETLASTAVTLGNMPQNPDDTLVRLTWTGSSPASSVTGYVIYGREAGQETFLSRVQSGVALYDDDGSDVPATLATPQTADTTGGPVAKYIIRFDNRLVLAGISGQTSRVMVSGPADVNQNEKFHWSQGGAFVDVDKDSGDEIVGLGVFGSKILVFKEKSVWELSLNTVTFGNWDVLELQPRSITLSHGGISHRSIAFVENDVFYLTRNGVYTIGYEPNIINVIRANEISVKIRDFFDTLSVDDMEMSSAEYIDNKYILSFRGAQKTIVYDRERNAWMGPWTTNYGITSWDKHLDSGNSEYWLAATDDGYVTQFTTGAKSDRGAAFTTKLKTKREDWDSWATFKNIHDMVAEFRDVAGNVESSIIVEGLDGKTNVAADFTIEGSTTDVSWGPAPWGNAQWGDSEESGTAADVTELIKRILLNETGRTIQVQISTDKVSDDYELLGIRINAKPIGRGTTPYSWNI